MLNPDNLFVISFVTCCENSNGKPVKGTKEEHMLLFNKTQISEEEVNALIDNGEWMHDSRVVKVTKEQIRNLKDKD